MKILIVKTSSMGDIIHALPVVQDIVANRADCEIHWVAEESFRDIPTLAPAVKTVHVCAFRRWRKSLFSRETCAEVRAFKAALRAEHYDLVIDIQGLLRSGLLTHWTKAPSVGYTRRTIREPLAAFFYHQHLDLPESLGAVRRYRMALANALGYEIQGDPRFALSPKDTSWLADQREPFVALAINTSRDEKLWPEASWMALGQRLATVGLRSALFWGNAKERERSEAVAAQIPGAVVVPRLSLSQTAATLAQARAVIGVDTGLSHLGAALGRPSVGIFVSTPTETLQLIGDGPVRSLGGIGVCPSLEDVWQAFEAVHGELK